MTQTPPSPDALREALAPHLVSIKELAAESPHQSLTFLPFPAGIPRMAVHESSDSHLPLGIYRLPHMTLIGAHAVIATSQNKIIREQNAETVIEKSIGVISRDVSEETPSLPLAVSLVSAASYNFYHWIIDSLPKVIVAEACGFTGRYVVPAPQVNPIVAESLAILGIPPERLFPMTYAAVLVDELWIPTHMHGHHMEATPELHAAFRSKMVSGCSVISTPRKARLYIRRSPSRRIRYITNGDALERLLRSFEFEVFEMERMTLREQIALSSRASLLLGPHGAGMIHSLWMPERSSVIELLPVSYQSTVMSVHPRLLGNTYMPFITASEGAEMAMTVDCEKLHQVLQSLSR